MASKQHYIYIPGLGDYYDPGRRLLMATWRWRQGVSGSLVSMHWFDKDEACHQKQQRIAEAIAAVSSDRQVILVGESAGGAMAISMLSVIPERIDRVVTICGKNIGADTIGPQYLRKYTALSDSVRAAEQTISRLDSYQKQKIHNIYNRRDPLIRRADTALVGARQSAISFIGHQLSVIYIAGLRFDLISR